MKKYKLIINPFAEEYLTNAKAWYDDKSEEMGDEVV
jgi:hypothetical protein